MQTFIALFRGINVGGRNRITMQVLRDAVAAAGFDKVRSYIQSGNIAFETCRDDVAAMTQCIQDAVAAKAAFAPKVQLLSVAEMSAAVQCNPFAAADPQSLHLFFLAAESTQPDWDKAVSMCTETEAYQLQGKVFYFHAPDGVARSKLFAAVEKVLGVSAAARNWRSVSKILEMAS